MLSYLKISSSSSRLIISNRRVISSSILFDLHPLSVTKVKATYAINNYPIGTMNWEQVKEVVNTNRLELLGRNPQQQEVYEKFRSELALKWMSVTEYLYVTKFNFDSAINDDNKMIAIRPSPENIDKDRTFLFPNDFPYNFSSNINHYCLWKLSHITEEEVEQKAIELMKEQQATDYLVYINPPALKSVLDIEHGHILIYKKE